jgi:hypothetical protein
MSDVAGVFANGMLQTFQTVLSSNLTGYSSALIGGPTLVFASDPRGSSVPGAPQFVSWGTVGAAYGLFGDYWFDRIIVLPRIVGVGSVLSLRIFTAEVWSTFRDRQQALAAISITGSGGLQVAGPAAMTFNPGQSQIYTLTLESAGDPVINNLVTWTFSGLGGADCLVTGSRVLLFPFAMDWTEPFSETISFKTSVLPAYNTEEQRIQRRHMPRYTLAFRVVPLSPIESAYLDALLTGCMDRPFGVPVWPEQSVLTAPAAIGDTSLQADLTNRPSFEEGGFVMVRGDSFTVEAFQITTISGNNLGLASPATKAWSLGTRIVPIRRGWLLDDPSLGRPTNWLSAASYTFSCEDQ